MVVAQQTGMSPSKSVEEALDRINGNLAVFGMMGQMMYSGMSEAVKEGVTAINTGDRISPLYDLAYYSIKGYLEAQGTPSDQIDIAMIKGVPDEQKQQIVQMSLMKAVGSVLVDAGVLMHRVRQDSDLFRTAVQSIGGPNKLLEGIQGELHMMNGMLASIPVMATQMDAMTRQMGVMSYSVGSTMGRAGSWMPW
jgi:hypothetical protein